MAETRLPSSVDPVPDAVKEYLSKTASQELDALRAALDERLAALEAALSEPDRHDSLERLIIELARVATSESEAAAARACLQAEVDAQDRSAALSAEAQRTVEQERAGKMELTTELEQTRASLASLRNDFAQMRESIEGERAQMRESIETERRAAETERHAVEAERNASVQLRAEHWAVGAELSQERATKSQLTETIADLQREIAEITRNAAGASLERDALRVELEASRRATEHAREAADLAREALADARAQLTTLELRVQAARAVRGASRYAFSDTFDVDIGGQPGVLVDLSIKGAQVLMSASAETGRIVEVVLRSEETPVSGYGRIIWSYPEPVPSEEGFGFRAGVLFTQIDEAAVEAYLIRYATGRRGS